MFRGAAFRVLGIRVLSGLYRGYIGVILGLY